MQLCQHHFVSLHFSHCFPSISKQSNSPMWDGIIYPSSPLNVPIASIRYNENHIITFSTNKQINNANQNSTTLTMSQSWFNGTWSTARQPTCPPPTVPGHSLGPVPLLDQQQVDIAVQGTTPTLEVMSAYFRMDRFILLRLLVKRLFFLRLL
ncbi:hypothetical protein DL98DRAFT_123060 [Cadophora sp. DSE1049]|nr:hypothetical protein DL98DRAFT_123060 [Cadophora sp. DSE1049]